MLVEEIFSSSYINDREKNILRLKYGIGIEKPLTLKEIGKIMNLQFTNISRIEKAALRKIRARYRNVEHLKK
jgi:DNA-directed RNA polymerase sigma subunit (sigma70/sigma32)